MIKQIVGEASVTLLTVLPIIAVINFFQKGWVYAAWDLIVGVPIALGLYWLTRKWRRSGVSM